MCNDVWNCCTYGVHCVHIHILLPYLKKNINVNQTLIKISFSKRNIFKQNKKNHLAKTSSSEWLKRSKTQVCWIQENVSPGFRAKRDGLKVPGKVGPRRPWQAASGSSVSGHLRAAGGRHCFSPSRAPQSVPGVHGTRGGGDNMDPRKTGQGKKKHKKPKLKEKIEKIERKKKTAKN